MLLTAHGAQNRERAAIAGATEVLTGALRASLRAGGDLQTDSLRVAALANCLADATSARNAAALSAVIAVLRAYHNKSYADAAAAALAEMQHMGCLALSNIAEYTNTDGRVGAVAAGAADVLLAALRAHPSIEKVQFVGCTALQRLFADANVALRTSERDGSRAATLAHEVLKAVLFAMNEHRSVQRMQRTGCYVLQSLMHWPGMPAKLSAAGAVEAVVATLRTRPADDTRTLVTGCETLRVICPVSQPTPACVAAAGAFTAVIAVLRMHPADAGLQRVALGTLTSLLANYERTGMEARTMGAFDAILTAMRTHPQHAPVQLNGCMGLTFIARAERARGGASPVYGRAAIEPVIAALQTQFSDESISLMSLRVDNVRYDAMQALSTMVAGLEAEEAAAIRAGALEALTGDALSGVRGGGGPRGGG
jgi:hypothetical protein